VLKSQGLQANQDVTFLTDGGQEVRALTELVTPEAQHVLDWFHITMRLTVLPCLAESTVNAVISKRFAKRQQMQWTKRGAHLLLQTRTRTLDGTLRSMFERWHPGLANDDILAAAA